MWIKKEQTKLQSRLLLTLCLQNWEAERERDTPTHTDRERQTLTEIKAETDERERAVTSEHGIPSKEERE